MTAPRPFEHDLPVLLEDLYLTGTPDYRDDLFQQTARTRQRPAWSFLTRWIPMDVATRRLPFAPPGWLQRLERGTQMGLIVRSTAVAAVIAIAVFAGLQFASRIPGVGGPPSPSPTDVRTPSPSTTASSAPTPTASLAAGCVNPPTDITTLIDLQSKGPLDPAGDPVACYGNAPLTFDATWSGGGQADCPTAPEPAWLACLPYGLQPFGDTRKLGAPELFVAVDPSVSLGILLTESFPQIRVTGHFDDPAAQTCRETNQPDAQSLAPVAVMIERCRGTFVVTQIVPLQPRSSSSPTSPRPPG